MELRFTSSSDPVNGTTTKSDLSDAVFTLLLPLLQRDDDLLHSLIVFFFIHNESDVPIKEDGLILLNVFRKMQFPAVDSFSKLLIGQERLKNRM